MLGIPTELVTLIGTTIIASIIKLLAQKMENAKANHQMMMQAFAAQAAERKEIRESTNVRFQWTRRTIALSAVFSIVVLPKLAAVFYPDMAVTVGWTETTGGLWPFIGEGNKLVWNVAQGLVITPLDTHLMSAIAGLYFGGSLAGHR